MEFTMPLLVPKMLGEMTMRGKPPALSGRETIDGAKCDIVAVDITPAGEAGAARVVFGIGVDDHLLRRLRFEQSKDGQPVVVQEVTITNLRPNAEIDASRFAQKPPEGYSVEHVKADPPPQMLAVGDKAPAFTLKNAKDETVSLADFKGKILLLDFWGTWCGPCQMAMPAIQKVHAKYKDKGVVVIGISCREKPGADPAKMMKEKGCDYGLLLNGETITKDWHIPGYPTLYVIDREGKIAYNELGYDEDLEGKVSEAIEALLKK
jgi:peroxiredoxin